MAGVQNNGFNPNFVVNVNKGAKPQRPEAAKAEEHAVKQPEVRPQERPQVSANDVLSFMANSSIYTTIATTKQINPAKYVSADQKVEIAKSMESFESKFEEYFNSIVDEVPGIGEAAAMTLAAKMVEDEI
ncbi:hypothetical protein IJ732_05470 [bacterium]|nr:hypothetical protein [bacterium]